MRHFFLFEANKTWHNTQEEDWLVFKRSSVGGFTCKSKGELL